MEDASSAGESLPVAVRTMQNTAGMIREPQIAEKSLISM